jgi:hypothetical protein
MIKNDLQQWKQLHTKQEVSAPRRPQTKADLLDKELNGVHMVRCRLCSFDVVFTTLLHNAAIYSPCGDISISCPSMLCLLPFFAHFAVDL